MFLSWLGLYCTKTVINCKFLNHLFSWESMFMNYKVSSVSLFSFLAFRKYYTRISFATLPWKWFDLFIRFPYGDGFIGTRIAQAIGASLVSQLVRNLPTVQETWFNPWLRKIPWRRKWQPTPVSLPGEARGQRSLVGYSPWGHKSRTWLSNWTTTLEGNAWLPRSLV